MAIIHFLNVLEGDCNIIQHDSGHISVIDVCNADDGVETDEKKMVRDSKEWKSLFNSKMPTTRKNYNQKATPDNPIEYLKKLTTNRIFRFIITHPDMDHLDGIEDLYEIFKPINTWDTDNNKHIDLSNFCAKYNKEDWNFYKKLRDRLYTDTKRLTYYSNTTPCQYWDSDNINVLCPTQKLVKEANENSSEDYNDVSYVILFTPPKKGGGHWKIIFGGDSHDASWKHIINTYEKEVSNIDILFAPHHGRSSQRDWSFLDVLKPTLTLMGNASSEYLAYDKYTGLHITNNQAGYIILDISPDAIKVYVKNKNYAADFCKDQNLNGLPVYDREKQAYIIGYINAK
jgi:beta-lactamase superfamily II metal-dependent hydrolase